MKRLSLALALIACAAIVWAADLPVTDVVLFSSGVGYFQRVGAVQNDAAVQLSFKPEQINDLLKSMVLLDLDGGTVGSVTYGAKDPISKTLQAFAVNITDNPSLAQLLNRLRGVSAEVTATNTVTGKILGVEVKKRAVEKELVEVEVLNLLTDDGIKSVRLEEITSLKLLDQKLNKELQDALAVVASGLDNQRKPVTISFNGKGERRVLVGYLAETPVWKTSYRLVMDDKDSLLQGWAVVENTTDADWSNVRLSLVSGRPISFIQDLYTPLYVPRPLVKPEVYASLRPVAYAGDEMRNYLDVSGDMSIVNGLAAGKDAPKPLTGIYPGPASSPVTLSFDTNQTGISFQRIAAEQVRSSVISAAQATDLGQAFQYAIDAPVNLPRQQSAMLPIVAAGVGAWKVSIYNPQVHAKFPLYGLRLKNTTGVHLMGGPITVYNNGTYAGDATFEDLQPNEQRLISYAIDLGVEGQQEEKANKEEILAFKAAKGVLYVTRKYRRNVEYTFKVKDGKERVIVVEHPYNEGWDLVEPKKADEKTDHLYRFTVRPDDKGIAKLTVIEENTVVEGEMMTNLNADTIVAYMKNGKISDPVRQSLQRLMEMQGLLQEIRRKKSLYQQEIQTITNEQNRIRDNMSALDRGSDLYKRYVAKLSDQETRIERLRNEIANLQEREEAQRKAIEDYVAGLNLE